MKQGLEKESIYRENEKRLRNLEDELSFKSSQSDFNPKAIIKRHYPLYFLNKNVLNSYVSESINNLIEKYKTE